MVGTVPGVPGWTLLIRSLRSPRDRCCPPHGHASTPHQLPEPPPQLSIPAHSLLHQHQVGVRARAEGSPPPTLPRKAQWGRGMGSWRGRPATSPPILILTTHGVPSSTMTQDKPNPAPSTPLRGPARHPSSRIICLRVLGSLWVLGRLRGKTPWRGPHKLADIPPPHPGRVLAPRSSSVPSKLHSQSLLHTCLCSAGFGSALGGLGHQRGGCKHCYHQIPACSHVIWPQQLAAALPHTPSALRFTVLHPLV